MYDCIASETIVRALVCPFGDRKFQALDSMKIKQGCKDVIQMVVRLFRSEILQISQSR